MTYKKPDVVFEGAGNPTGKDSIRIIPLGGSGNVTKNMYLYEYRYDGAIRDILIVDCGIGFPEAEMYGVDLVIPDVRYLQDKKKYIRGLVFTHGHDDHIGGIPYIYRQLGNINLYGTRLTAAFANIKLREIKIKSKVRTVSFDERLSLGPFRVSFVRMTHSIPDAANLIIETPIGIFYHGSDFKFDFTPLDGKVSELSKINQVGSQGVLCLMTDCLGSERRGLTPSEQVIGETIDRELSHCQGQFIFTTQSSNISRIQLAIEKAIAHSRQIAFFGRSIDQNIEEALNLGIMKFPRDAVISEKGLKKISPQKLCLIIAGSQGQPESALMRAAGGEHKFVQISQGDTVMISAEPIPGNENNVYLLIELLYKRGARVSYSDIMEDLHVSGHGSQGDLMLLLSAIGPKYVYPIGGTYRHIMQYQRLALELGYRQRQILIPSEGEILEFKASSEPKIIDTIELQNVMVDGLGVGDVGEVVLRDRQTIAREGIIVIVVPIAQSTGKITAQPDVITRGFVYVKESKRLLDKTRLVVLDALKLKRGKIINWHFIRKKVEADVGSFLHKETGRSPLVVPVIVEV